MYKVVIFSISLCAMQPLFATPNSLFKYYPLLQNTLSYISLGEFPTPIYYCSLLSTDYPSTKIYIKHDGLTGKKQFDGTRAFGGNKLRKLQYLLADTLA